MRKLMSLVIAALCFSLAGPIVAHAGEHQSAPRAGSPEFERMKQLVGAWEGTSEMGKEGERVRVEYRLTAGGSALVETLSPGGAEEMGGSRDSISNFSHDRAKPYCIQS